MPPKSESSQTWKNLTAGGVAGALEAFIMYPTEYVKTQLQLEANAAKKAAKEGKPVPEAKYKNITGCIKVTWKERGITGFYRGCSTLIVGSMPKAAVRFAAYNQFASLLKDEKGKLTSTRTMLAGLGAGVTEAIVAVTPMETVKTKFIHDQNSKNPKYRGLIHGCGVIFKEEGIGGFYKGLVPTMLKQGCNQACRFFVFNTLKASLLAGQKRELKPYESMAIGGVAGILSVYATMPFDVVKTRMQGLEASQYKNSLHCGYVIVRDEGILALWKGTIPRLSRVMFSSGLIFTFFEQTMRILNRYFPDPPKKAAA